MSEGAKTSSKNLQELEQNGNFWFIRLSPVLLHSSNAVSFFSHLRDHFSLSDAIFGGSVLSNSIAVACVAVHADPLAFLHLVLISILAGTEIRIPGFELTVEADDGQSVGGVAVVAADGPVSALAHAVAHFGKVQLVQQVLVETRVFVDSVVLTVAITGGVGGAVIKLNVG